MDEMTVNVREMSDEDLLDFLGAPGWVNTRPEIRRRLYPSCNECRDRKPRLDALVSRFVTLKAEAEVNA